MVHVSLSGQGMGQGGQPQDFVEGGAQELPRQAPQLQVPALWGLGAPLKQEEG